MTKYHVMLTDARERLGQIEKERSHLLELVRQLEHLVRVADGNAVPVSTAAPATPSVAAGPTRPADTSSETPTLFRSAVAILQEAGKPLRTVDLMRGITERTGRRFDYSSLAKALNRDDSSPTGIVRKVGKTWALRSWSATRSGGGKAREREVWLRS